MCVAPSFLPSAAYLQRLSLQPQLPRLLPASQRRKEGARDRKKKRRRRRVVLRHSDSLVFSLPLALSLSLSSFPPSLPPSASLPSLQLDCLASAFYSQCLYNIKWWEEKKLWREKKEKKKKRLIPASFSLRSTSSYTSMASSSNKRLFSCVWHKQNINTMHSISEDTRV